MMTCCILLIVFLISFSVLFYKYKSNNKKYLEKIDVLRHNIEKINMVKKDLKFRSYHMIFKTIRHIFTHFNPETISLYLYNNKKELNITTIKFLYQIKSTGNEPDVIFTGNHDNIPITNIDAVTKAYFCEKFMLLKNIEELNKYDRGLYQSLKKDGINRLYLINIYNNDVCKHKEKNYTKNKPIGFFSLTYKNKILTENEISTLLIETEKVSEHLVNVLS